VAEELRLYSDLVSTGSFLVVMDTLINELPPDLSADRPWGPDDNPALAVEEFLRTDHRFERAVPLNDKLLASAARGGYLQRVG
jgi:cephalosporin hydroxylase